MRKDFIVICLIQLLVLSSYSVCFSRRSSNSVQTDTAKITFIANAGFLVESSGVKVLIDALFTEGWGYFMTPSPHIRSQIISGDSVFADANIFLITHGDGDHFNDSLVNDYLASNNSRYLLCTNQINDIMKTRQDYDSYKNRILVITPPYFSSIDTTVNKLKIKVLRLRHEGSTGNDENVGYVINFNGLTILHTGDNDGYLGAGQTISGIMEYSRLGMDSIKVDIAILGNGFFWDANSPGIQIVRNYIKPKHIILCHYTINDWQSEWNRMQNVIRPYGTQLPDITVPQNSMDINTYLINNNQTGVQIDNSLPSNSMLNHNYPNPFNPTTVISYQLSASSNVKLMIYNVLGQKIKTLVDSYQGIGKYTLTWNTTDDRNNPVSSGIYFYRLETDFNALQNKMVLLR